MKQLIYRALHLLDEQQSFIIAKIVDSHGSAPRKSGWMLIEPSGAFLGSIGGGALEGMVLTLAKDLIAEKHSMLKHFHLGGNDIDGLDMRCGGDVDIQLDYIDGSDLNASQTCRATLREMEEKKEVFIIGAGHVGLALAKQLTLLDIPVIIMDDRAEYANTDRFPEAKEIKVLKGFQDVFSGYAPDENSYIVIVTRGHKWDLDVLFQALQTKAGYIGMIGSRRKIAGCYDTLRQKGISEDRISQVDAPIGLDIPCETPEEIAVSIAGKLLCVKYGKEVR